MSDKPHLYVLVRIRKSGSQSLVKMATSALPNSRIYAMPPIPPLADLGNSFLEDFRRVRRTKKRLWKLFKTTSYPHAWDLLNERANEGDIVSGHFMYGSPVLPDWDLKYITMVREPIMRLYSEYRYCRQSYFQRPAWRRSYLAARLKVAGTGEFRDYVKYLASHGNRFANPFIGYVTGGQDVIDPYQFLRERYFHYGTVERMDDYIAGLSEKLGRHIDPVWTNKTEKSGAIDAEEYDRDEIAMLLGRDLELYQTISAE